MWAGLGAALGILQFNRPPLDGAIDGGRLWLVHPRLLLSILIFFCVCVSLLNLLFWWVFFCCGCGWIFEFTRGWMQPYRTLPLVLPGAKVARDNAATTQSYLALQSNPLLWSSTPGAPSQAATDAVLKQKVNVTLGLSKRFKVHRWSRWTVEPLNRWVEQR